MTKMALKWASLANAFVALQACAMVTVADAAITVVAAGIKAATKALDAVADAVIPDSDDDN